MNRVTVIGSLNMDMVSEVVRFPNPGETVLAKHYTEIPGGKGANQAYAAAKLGAEVTMLGAVGEDETGLKLLESLSSVGVDVSRVKRCTEEDGVTGRAVITVDADGQNNIVVAQGANLYTDIAYVEQHLDAIESCDVLLLQLEIPLETVVYCAKYARSMGKKVILDPAPAIPKLPVELLSTLDVIKPNEVEIEMLVHGLVEDESLNDSIAKSAELLIDAGVKHVIVTLGEEGSALFDQTGKKVLIPSYPVNVVDTTAAGDAYTGALGMALSRGIVIEEAMVIATKAATLAVSRKGAQSSMPSAEEIEMFES